MTHFGATILVEINYISGVKAKGWKVGMLEGWNLAKRI